ncbi:MAG: CPBP family intramembrane glutamic endopeptidase [Rhodanobacteraceae bacterium]
MLIHALFSALVNVVFLVVLPLAVYYGYHRWRHHRRFAEVARRAGLQMGDPRFIGYAAIGAAVVIIALLVFPPSLESSTAKGSGFAPFAGLGLGMPALVMALLYGVVKTGFAEEFLFRGLIAGSLGRRLPLIWANVLQALVFLLPHALVLLIMPSMWVVLPVVFAGALFAGWLRIRSESILGPWLLHASANVTVALSVAARSIA